MSKSVYQIILELEGDTKTKQALQEIGTAAGLTGAALLAFSAGAGKAAAEYDQNLRLVNTLLDDTTVSAQEFSDGLFDLTASTKGLINPNEGVIASYDMMSAGIKDQSALYTSLERSQKAAVVGQSDLATISKAATAVVNAQGDALGKGLTQAEKFDKVINLMVQTQADGVITGAEYAAGIGNIISNAQGAGVSLEALNAAIALSTVKGTPASQAMSRLGQLISNIQKPTAEATKEAERLGIQFDASALKSKGLVGLMTELATNTNLADDSFAKLFGSTEALGIAQQLTANGGTELQAMLDKQLNSSGALDTAYEKMADGSLLKFQQSMNLLNASFIKLGQGVMVATEPIIALIGELAAQLAEFSNTPVGEKFLAFLGVLILGGGTILTVAGAITLLATSIGTVNTAIGLTTTFINGKLIPSFAKMLISSNATTVGITGMRAALIGLQAAVPVLIALAGAVAAVTLAIKQYQNIETELKNLELEGAINSTQKLADKATSLGLRIQETGKAIPDAEFKAWIATLEDANRGNGQLTGIIDALKRKQEQAKAGTEKDTKATQSNTQSKEDQAEALEKAKEAFAEYESGIRDSISNIQADSANDLTAIELTDGSDESKISASLAVKESAINDEIALLEKLKSNKNASKEDIIRIENEITAKSLELQKARKDAVEQLEELRTQNLRNQLDTRKAIIESEFATTGNIEKYLNDSNKLIEDRYQLESKLIDEKLAKVTKGSAEESKLILDKANLELNKTKEIQALETKRIDDRIEGLKNVADQERALLDLQVQGLEIESTLLDTKSKLYDGIASNAKSIGDLLNEGNLTQEQTNELLRLGSDLTGQKLTVENAQLALTEAINQAEINKLEIKRAQIQLDIEQLRIANEIKQLELDTQKQEITTKLEDKSLSARERERLNNQLSNIDAQKDLSNKATTARVDSLNLETSLLDFTIELTKLTQDIKANPEPKTESDQKSKNESPTNSTNNNRGNNRSSSDQTRAVNEPTLGQNQNRSSETNLGLVTNQLKLIKGDTASLVQTVDSIGKAVQNLSDGLIAVNNNLQTINSNLRSAPARRS